MHNKFCVIDKKILINGSYNWTYYAENKNSENILLIKNEQQTIDAFHKEFHFLKSQLKEVIQVQILTKFEVDEFNPLSARNYLANDIVYEAKALGKPELIDMAFKIAPTNIQIQQTAVALDLTKKRKLNYSIGVRLKGNKYLKIVEKGALIPLTNTSIVCTSEANQVASGSTIYFGENKKATTNIEIAKLTLLGLPKKPAGEAKMKYIFTIDIYGKLSMIKYSLDNGKRVTTSADVNNLLEYE